MSGESPQIGDLVWAGGFRVVAIHGDDVLLHYERPVDVAQALKRADIRSALRNSVHLWVRVDDVRATS